MRCKFRVFCAAPGACAPYCTSCRPWELGSPQVSTPNHRRNRCNRSASSAGSPCTSARWGSYVVKLRLDELGRVKTWRRTALLSANRAKQQPKQGDDGTARSGLPRASSRTYVAVRVQDYIVVNQAHLFVRCCLNKCSPHFNKFCFCHATVSAPRRSLFPGICPISPKRSSVAILHILYLKCVFSESSGAVDAAVAIGARRPRKPARVLRRITWVLSADEPSLANRCIQCAQPALSPLSVALLPDPQLRPKTPRLHLHHPSGPATALG